MTNGNDIVVQAAVIALIAGALGYLDTLPSSHMTEILARINWIMLALIVLSLVVRLATTVLLGSRRHAAGSREEENEH